jgi:hypothetical protein
MKTGYVIFREDPNTHNESYITSNFTLDGMFIASESPEEARTFDTAGAAYKYAGEFSPTLDNWRVGLR